MLTSLTPNKKGLNDGDLEQSLLRTIQSRGVGMSNETEVEVGLRQETHTEGKPNTSCDNFTRNNYARGDEAPQSCPTQVATLHQDEEVANQTREKGSTNHNYPGTPLKSQQRLEKLMRIERK